MKYFLSITILGIILCANFLPHQVSAQTDYTLLAPIPLEKSKCTGSANETCKTNASAYIEGIFILIIGIATALAVLMIIFGGIKYMSTDAFEGKSEARTTIQNAIWGLLLAISAWLILNTINPNLTKFNLSITKQEIPANTNIPGGGDIPLPSDPNNCLGCRTLGTIPHKLPPLGCAAPGPCVVNSTLYSRLELLDLGTNFLVTESFPPTRVHQATCHSDGTCVDATISSNTPQNIKGFIDAANVAALRAVFEVESDARAQTIRQATGLSATQVIYVPGITGEHFSVYLQ